MQDAVSRLYGHIMIFFHDVVKWYRKSSTGRALSSIFKPFDVEYKDTVEEIRMCTGIMDEIANAAGRAEIRDIRIYVQMQYQRMEVIQNRVTEVLQVATGRFMALSRWIEYLLDKTQSTSP